MSPNFHPWKPSQVGTSAPFLEMKILSLRQIDQPTQSLNKNIPKVAIAFKII
jgi:hypothetical protein